MRLLQIQDKVNHDFQGVYECETCHGVRIDKSLDSYDDANFYENVIPTMTCYLCDKEAPLSKRYQMALDTLAWAVKSWGRPYQGEEIGFPSIDTVSTWGRDIKNVKVDFHHDGQAVTATREGHAFDDADEIGAGAEELVSLVVKDLAAQSKGVK